MIGYQHGRGVVYVAGVVVDGRCRSREREISQAISEMMISNVHANSGGSGERASHTHRRTHTHQQSIDLVSGLERDRQRATSFASSNRGREAKALTEETGDRAPEERVRATATTEGKHWRRTQSQTPLLLSVAAAATNRKVKPKNHHHRKRATAIIESPYSTNRFNIRGWESSLLQPLLVGWCYVTVRYGVYPHRPWYEFHHVAVPLAFGSAEFPRGNSLV